MNFQWSLSALTLFERCKFAYKCRYVLRIKDTRPLSAPAQRGIDTHKTIENFIVHGHPLTPELAGKWSHAFSELKKLPVKVEHKIGLDRNWQVVPYDTAWLRMVLDAKLVSPPVYKNYDWKTGKEYPEHFDQKELYSLGMMAEEPEAKSVKSVHVYLDQGKQTVREYHRDSAPSRQAQWAARAAKAENYVAMGPDHIGWVPEPNFTCKFCSFSKANGGPCKF